MLLGFRKTALMWLLLGVAAPEAADERSFELWSPFSSSSLSSSSSSSSSSLSSSSSSSPSPLLPSPPPPSPFSLSKWHAKLRRDEAAATLLELEPRGPGRGTSLFAADADATAKMNTYACQIGGNGRIYLQHLRKAGGTSLRSYLANQSCPQHSSKRAFDFFVQERRVFTPGLLSEPGTLVVTVIRHPIRRALSSYSFEGRWKQMERVRRKGNARSFDAWVKYIDNERKTKPSWSVWIDIENYYIQVLAACRRRGMVTRTPSDAVDKRWHADYLRALSFLESFDAVLIMEWLPCFEQSSWTQHRLGLREPMPLSTHLNRGRRGGTQRLSRINATDVERLYRLNKYDLMLYERARAITHTRIQSHVQSSLFTAAAAAGGAQAEVNYCSEALRRGSKAGADAGAAKQPPAITLPPAFPPLRADVSQIDGQHLQCGPAVGGESLASQVGMVGKVPFANRKGCVATGSVAADDRS